MDNILSKTQNNMHMFKNIYFEIFHNIQVDLFFYKYFSIIINIKIFSNVNVIFKFLLKQC